MRALPLAATIVAIAVGASAPARSFQNEPPRNGYMQPGNPDRGVPNGDPRLGDINRDHGRDDGDRGNGDRGFGGRAEVRDGRDGDRRTVRCESRNNRPQRCDIGQGDRVRLDRQLGSRPCIEGRSWFRDRRSVTVTNGCRGEFRVRD